MDKTTQQYSHHHHREDENPPTILFYFKTITSITTYGYLAKWTWNINQYIGLSNKIISVVLGLLCIRGAFRRTWANNLINAIFAFSAFGYAAKWLFIFDYFGFVCRIMAAIFGYLCITNIVRLMKAAGQ